MCRWYSDCKSGVIWRVSHCKYGEKVPAWASWACHSGRQLFQLCWRSKYVQCKMSASVAVVCHVCCWFTTYCCHRSIWWTDMNIIKLMQIRHVMIRLVERVIIESLVLLLCRTSGWGDSVLTQSTLTSLVDALPFHHRSTLHYLMTHLCRVCRLQVEAGHQEPLSSLCVIFCHIILRPAWENIM